MSAATPPPPAPPPTSPAAAGSYPVTLSFDLPEKIARWRIIGNIILAIPQLIVLYALGIVAELLAVVTWFAALFTGKAPEGMLGVIAMCLRYQTRVMLYAGFLTEEYPPFTFATSFADPGDYASLRVNFPSETEGRNRLTIFFRIIMAIPLVIVLYVFYLGAAVVYLIAWFAVLFTGKWPAGLRNYAVGVTRFATRFSAYVYLLTDEYPPFGLS